MPTYSSIKRIKDGAEKKRTVEKLLKLRTQLDQQVPAKTATDTLLLATWNIRAFGDNRRPESLHYIAEIISRFDLVAIQEVSNNMAGLEKVVALLGPNWDYIVTDSTEGVAGGGERMAFVFDRCKVFFRKMAGKIVLPESKLIDKEKKWQFARTPFTVAFQAGWFRFVLTTVHVYYGTNTAEDVRRVQEIDAIADFLKKRAVKEDENYILLGDFNIFKHSDATMKALEKHGFYVPAALREHPSDIGKAKYYDQIAFKLKLEQNMTVFAEGKQHAGAFDFTESVYTAQDLDVYRGYFEEQNSGKTEKAINTYYLSSWRTFEMSDHLPLWIELKVDFSNQYLKNIAASVQPSVQPSVQTVSSGSYVGNEKSKMLHLASCGSSPQASNSVPFDSRDAATDAGYTTACSKCKP
jgi:endonuclease/exonuclease/phosphatase family metal-dependent hydrolase